MIRADDGEDAEVLRKHLEERVELMQGGELGVGFVGEDPGALAEVVENEACLDEGPGGVDVGLADVAHVGVEGLGAGRAEEYIAEDHEAGLVEVAVKQERDAAQRVERTEDVEVRADVHEADDAKVEEPDGHDRAEGLADHGGAGALHGEQHAEDGDGDKDDDVLVVADDAVEERDRAETLDGRGDRYRGREDAVREQRGAANHGGDDEPLGAALHQTVEGEDAALVVVVRLHGDEHVLDGGDEGHRPDDEGQRADDDVLAHRGEAAVAAHDRLERVHRARSDVAVDDAKRNENHRRG